MRAWIPLLVSAMLVLGACTQAPIRLYAGPVRDAAAIASVELPEQIEVAQLNGVDVPAAQGMGSKGDRTLELAPGRYDLLVFYREIWGQGDNHEVLRSDPVRLVFDAAAGQRYRVDYRRPGSASEASALAADFEARISDPVTGQQIESQASGLAFRGGLLAQVQGDRTLVQAVSREEGQQTVAPLSQSPVSPAATAPAPASAMPADDQLLLVKAWWNQANAEQRRAFLEWVATPR
ncbi:MAG TPA: DUF2057 family protein [Fontimonas sp.]